MNNIQLICKVLNLFEYLNVFVKFSNILRMDQSPPFRELMELSAIPPLSEEWLDAIQSFLISGFDDEIKKKIPLIIEFFCQNLPNSADYQIENTPEIKRLQMRILNLLHAIKPSFLNENLSSMIEEKLFNLINFDGYLKNQAFSILVDHFALDIHGNPDRSGEFLEFAHNHLKSLIKDLNFAMFPNVDYDFTILLISSFKVIIIHDKNRTEEIPGYFETLLKVATHCVSFSKSEFFFPHIEQICSKALRTVAKLFEQIPRISSKPTLSEYIHYIMDLNTSIPRDVKYTHVYINFLLLCSSIFSIGESKVPPIIVDIVKKDIIKNLSIFAQHPYVDSRRLCSFLENICRGFNESLNNEKDLTNDLLSSIYQFISSGELSSTCLKLSIDMFKKICTSETYKTNTTKMNDIIEQLMTIIEFHSENNYDSPDNWVEMHIYCMKIMTPLMNQFLDKQRKDQKMSRMDILSRLTKYISHIIERFADSYGNPKTKHPEFKIHRRNVMSLLTLYLEITSNVPFEWVYGFFKEHIQYLIPKQPEDAVFSSFFCGFLTKTKNVTSYFLAFVEYMTERIDVATPVQIDHLYKIITDTFTNPNILKNTSPDDVKKIAHSVYRLFLATLCANSSRTIELIFINLFILMYKIPPGKEHVLTYFINDVKQTGIDWSNILKEMKPEIIYSRLALAMYPVLDIATNFDPWYELFLPALELNEEKMNALYAFYSAVHNNFYKSFSETKQITKIKVINALTRQLASKNKQKIDIIRILLQQISDYVTQLSIETKIEKPLPKTVVIEDKRSHEKQEILLDTVFETYKTSGKEDIDFLFDIFQLCIKQMCYSTIVLDKTVNNIVEEIKKKKIDLFKEYFINLANEYQSLNENNETEEKEFNDEKQETENPNEQKQKPVNVHYTKVKYQCIYYHYLLFREIILIDGKEEEINDFLNNSQFLFYHTETVRTILEITDILLPKIHFSIKWLNFLLPIISSSQHEYKYGYSIIKKYVIDRKYETQTDFEFLKSIYKLCMNLTYPSNYYVHKIIKPLLKEIDSFPVMKEPMMKNRAEMIKKYLTVLNFKNIFLSYWFIFSRSFTEYARPIEIYDTVLKVIQKEPFIPLKLYTSQKYQKYILKLIAKGNYIDPQVTVFNRLRHFFKTLAYSLIALQQEGHQFVLALQLFTEKKFRCFLPYFLHSMEKGVKNGMGNFRILPKDPKNLIKLPTAISAMPRKMELRIIHFLLKSGNYKPYYSLFLNYILLYSTYLAKNYDPNKRNKILFVFETFYSMMNCFAKTNKELQVPIKVLQQLVDVAVIFNHFQYPIKLPIENAVHGLEEEFLTLFVQYLTKEPGTQNKLIVTNANIERINKYLNLWEYLFTLPSLQTFTSICIEKLYHQMENILIFYKTQGPFFGRLCLIAFNCFANVVSQGILPSRILEIMMRITIKIFQGIFKDYNRFKPSNFSNVVNILLPMKLENYINEHQFIDFILNQSIPFLLSKPEIFLHHFCVKRISATLNKLPFELQKQAILIYIPQINEKSIQSQIFFNIFLYDYFSEHVESMKKEKDQEKESNEEKAENDDEIQYGFDEISLSFNEVGPNEAPTTKFLYHYSISLLLEIPFISIPGIENLTEIWRVNAKIHELFLSKDYVGTDTITSYTKLSKILLNKQFQTEETIELYTKYLTELPFYTNIPYYIRLIGIYREKFSIKDNTHLQFIAMCMGLRFLGANSTIAKKALSIFPQYFKSIIQDFDPQFYPGLFNFFVSVCTFFLTLNDDYSTPYIIHAPPIFTFLSEKIDHSCVNMRRMELFKKQLSKLTSKEMPGLGSVMRLQYIFIPSIAKFLFSKNYNDNYFPECLMPHLFLQNKQIFDFFNFFKPVLRAVYQYGNTKAVQTIIDDIEKCLKKHPNVVISPQSETPFATLFKWASEIREVQLLKPVDAFVEALRPYNNYTLVNDLRRLNYPASKNFYRLIEGFIKEDVVNSHEELKVFHTKMQREVNQKIDYLTELWNNNWSAQPLEQHIFIFAKIYLEERISKLVNFMDPSKLHYLLVISLKYNIHKLNKFIRYYCSLFKDTTLSNVFYATELFANNLPQPYSSVYENVKYLQDITLSDDSLGLMISNHKSLTKAGSYHQLCQYDAAKEFYLQQLESNETKDAFSYSIYQLRSVTMNLDFTSMDITTPIYTRLQDIKSYSLDLPIVRLSSPTADEIEKTNVSRAILIPDSYYLLPALTSIQRLIIFDDVISTLRCLTVDPNMAFRKWHHHPDVLDRNCYLVSSVGFPIHQIQVYKTLQESNKSFFSYNLSFMSFLLIRVHALKQGIKAFKRAIEQIEYSIPPPGAPPTNIVQNGQAQPPLQEVKQETGKIPPQPANTAALQQQKQLPPAATNLLKNILPNASAAAVAAAAAKLAQQNKPGINALNRQIQQQQLHQQYQDIGDNRFSPTLTHWNIPRFYNMFQSLTAQQSDLTPVVRAKLSYFLELHDFDKFTKLYQLNKISNMSFIKFYSTMFVNFPKEFITPILFQNLAKQISNSMQANIEQFNTLLALAFAAVRKMPQYNKIFFQTLMSIPIDHVLGQAWLIWLPHVFSIFEQPPIDFVKNMISQFPFQVRGIMCNIVATRTAKSEKFLREDLPQIIMKTQFWPKFKEYDNMFMWLQTIDDDINKYKDSVFVHMKVAEELATGKDFSPEVKHIAGETIDDIIKYVKNNPPYLKTSKQNVDVQLSYSYKFPPLNNNMCYSLRVLADGTKDAIFQFTTNKGTVNNFTVVCLDLFPLNYSMEVFLQCVWSLFLSHPSVKTHSNFLDRSSTLYYLHNSLVLMTGDYRGLQQISGVDIIDKLLQRKKELMEKQENLTEYALRSPYAVSERKKIDYDKQSLTKWVLKASAGNRIDYLFMRDSLVSHISCISAIKFLFNSGYSIFPNMMFNKDRRKIMVPELTKSNRRVVYLPFTQTIKSFIPDFVLKGSFSTVWHIVFDSIQANSDKFVIFYNALIDPNERITNNLIQRATLLSTLEDIDTDKEDEPFQITVIDHLIKTSSDVCNCQEMAFAWI